MSAEDDSRQSRNQTIIISVVCGCIAVAALVCSIVFAVKTRNDRSLAGYAKRGAAFGVAEGLADGLTDVAVRSV